MEGIILILLAAATVLFIASFFQKDRTAKLENDLEQLAVSHMQDMYQLKKKVKLLEEELLIQDTPVPAVPQSRRTGSPAQINAILKNQVLSLYRQGLSIDQIVRQSTLSKELVMTVLETSGRERP